MGGDGNRRPRTRYLQAKKETEHRRTRLASVVLWVDRIGGEAEMENAFITLRTVKAIGGVRATSSGASHIGSQSVCPRRLLQV